MFSSKISFMGHKQDFLRLAQDMRRRGKLSQDMQGGLTRSIGTSALRRALLALSVQRRKHNRKRLRNAKFKGLRRLTSARVCDALHSSRYMAPLYMPSRIREFPLLFHRLKARLAAAAGPALAPGTNRTVRFWQIQRSGRLAFFAASENCA